MKRLGLVEVFRAAAREIEAVMHGHSGAARAVPQGAMSGAGGRPNFEALARSGRLQGLRPRPDSRGRAALSSPPVNLRTRHQALERAGFPPSPARAPIPLSPEPRTSRASAAATASGPGLGGYVAISEPVEIGDVLVTDPKDPTRMKLADVAADATITGVVSGDPRGNNTLAPATFRGFVMCKVDASYGEIAEGDFLTSSPTRGHAMRSSCRAPGTILGRALEALPTGRGRIRVQVTRR